MLASMMSLLSSQQRRVLSGHKHISFSRDQSGRLKSQATGSSATEHTGTRRRRPTERTPAQQAGPKQLDEQTLKQASSRSDRDHHKAQAREQFLQQTAKLGIAPASQLQSRPQQQRVTELPWSLSSPQQGTTASPSRSSSADSSSVDALSDSTLSTNSDGAESSSSTSRAGSSGSSTSSRKRRSSSRASEDSSSNDEHGISWQLSEEQQAVAAAISRISRFMDFRERCASEVVTKLTEVGYDRQFADKVLEHMQQTNMQDDARFAEMFVRGQWATKAQAPSRIAYELRNRRVAQEHIDAALAAVFGDSKQIAGREPTDDQQAASWERLVQACRSRAEASVGEPQQKRRAKLATWLQRRGHSLATAFRMFEELDI